MPYLVECEITGLAGRDKPFIHKFDRSMNVFFGKNGTGKTSLLKILASALRSDASMLKNVEFESARVVIHSLNYNQEFTFTTKRSSATKAQAEFLKLFDAAIATTRSSIEARTDDEVIRELARSRTPEKGITEWSVSPKPPKPNMLFEHVFLQTSRLLFGATGALGVASKLSDEELDLAFERTLEREWVRYSATLQSQLREVQAKGLADILKEVISPSSKAKPTAIESQHAYERVVTFLHRQDLTAKAPQKELFRERFAADQLLRSVVARIDKIENEIENKSAPVARLQSQLQKMFSGEKTIAFGPAAISVHGRNKQRIGVANLSSGEKHLLQILITCLQVEEAPVLIDEPEISMHVDWQRELLTAIRSLNPTIQIVTATHSPEIMADLDDAVIFSL